MFPENKIVLSGLTDTMIAITFLMLHDTPIIILSHLPVSRAVLWVNNHTESGRSEGFIMVPEPWYIIL